ncbi:DUF927 domain-containing protein [Elioraea sp.]|uniref:DUF927 domain-containing protein n=1 Tax=Elioraea sp. TaxID=2185103 RepID=UPI003F72794C
MTEDSGPPPIDLEEARKRSGKRGAKSVRAAIDSAAAAEVVSLRADQADADGTFLPAGFRLDANGLWRRAADPTKGKDQWLCGPFRVLAETRDRHGEGWGLLLSWQDRDRRTHRWIMPRALLASDAAEVRARLASRGLAIATSDGARRALTEFLARVTSVRLARTRYEVGWFFPAVGGACFVLPGETFGTPPDGEQVLLDLDPLPEVYRRAGSLADWQRTVATLALGNSRLIFALGCAFAGPLLEPLGLEGGGFHVRGESSRGKSTALAAAASVWGSPIGPQRFMRSWRSTANALELIAASHSQTLLPLNEIGEADPRDIGAICYMLSGGQGKQRMTDRRGLHRTPSWTTLFLSTGELSLGDMMAQGGRHAAAGQLARLPDIPADARAGLGLFEQLHGESDAASFAQRVQLATSQLHGTAGPAFCAWLAARVADPAWIDEEARPRLYAIAKRIMPAGADGQVQRVAQRFALVALAGELAAAAGVLPWPAGTGEAAAARVFGDWLDARGTIGAGETAALIARVRATIGAHAARFEAIRPTEDHDGGLVEPVPADLRVQNRLGWKWSEPNAAGVQLWHFGFIPQLFADEVCKPLGLHEKEARERLDQAGLLLTETRAGKRRRTFRRSVPGQGRVELVAFSAAALAGDDETEHAS